MCVCVCVCVCDVCVCDCVCILFVCLFVCFCFFSLFFLASNSIQTYTEFQISLLNFFEVTFSGGGG